MHTERTSYKYQSDVLDRGNDNYRGCIHVGNHKCREKIEEKTFQIILRNDPPKYWEIEDNPHRLFCKTLRFAKLFSKTDFYQVRVVEGIVLAL